MHVLQRRSYYDWLRACRKHIPDCDLECCKKIYAMRKGEVPLGRKWVQRVYESICGSDELTPEDIREIL